MDQETPHKTRDTETYRGESGKSLEDMGTGEKFLNRTVFPFLTLCTKLKFNWIKDLHRKLDTLKPIEEKVRKSLKYMSAREFSPCAHILEAFPHFLLYKFHLLWFYVEFLGPLQLELCTRR